MPAENNKFPWLSYYRNYNFFEQRMREHSKVVSCENINIGLYNIRLTNGKILKVFICECYAFGTAEYVESCENYGELNAVVISSNWCGYSLDIKRDCMQNNVGIFNIGGFMAAINRDMFWTYMTEYEKERFKEYGWL
ncbi:hypothetical protein ABVL72_24260 [Klebsiella pneumoniae]|uniref:hypothetical protein n=1 Tax=Klebsiella TaxID=570 RepID=UPI0007A9F770|nr:hypothetical protein [Klebsiella aerogenes]HBR2831190.1 hypothetical protein [Klebsiella pneumoniae]MDQ9493412.1 hypothetical protein [Klebsiella aerogenes]SAI97872.1 Uncharacterised protein [Klebsiella aerogenes]HBS6901913.1 hypothetical protein [Klebsiella pneumoniae]HBT8221682.1 hypothetical protein [Klebsiella pneumoniae]